MIFNLSNSKGKDSSSSYFGIFLCLISLFFDGMTAKQQESIKEKYHNKVSAYEFMFISTLFSALISGIFMLFSGELFKTYEFFFEFEQITQDVVFVSLLGTIGQFFIYYTIASFGPLLLSFLTTTRKFFTVLVSIIIYSHVINKY